MKKIISLLLVLVMVLSLGSAAMADTDYSSMSLDELKAELKTVTNGKLTVAMSSRSSPWTLTAS